MGHFNAPKRFSNAALASLLGEWDEIDEKFHGQLLFGVEQQLSPFAMEVTLQRKNWSKLLTCSIRLYEQLSNNAKFDLAKQVRHYYGDFMIGDMSPELLEEVVEIPELFEPIEPVLSELFGDEPLNLLLKSAPEAAYGHVMTNIAAEDKQGFRAPRI